MSDFVSYAVVSIGANNGLKYAERDAWNFARLMASAIGPVPRPEVSLFRGRAATVRAVLDHLDSLSWTGVTHLVVFASGHGNDDGIQLIDGMLTYRALGQRVRAIGAPVSLGIVDTCYAGAVLRAFGERVGGVADGWARHLVRTTPGLRLIMGSPADATTREDDSVRSGLLTHGLMVGMLHGTGEIANDSGRERWVSDVEAFGIANRIIRRRWPHDTLPQYIGPTGTPFPLVLSQAPSAVGHALVDGLRVSRDLRLRHRVRIVGRRHVPTRLRVQVRDDLDRVVADLSRWEIPSENDWRASHTVDTARHILGDSLSSMRHRSGQQVDFTWSLTVLDVHGHALCAAQLGESLQPLHGIW